MPSRPTSRSTSSWGQRSRDARSGSWPTPRRQSSTSSGAAPVMQQPGDDRVINAELEVEMRKAYLDYSMSVIVARALPDVRDGLKPVQRRILYAMHEMGLRNDRPFRKSAGIVGEVMGKYHPHGDVPIYDALLRQAPERVVDRHVAVRVILPHHLTDDARGLAERTIVAQPHLVHRVEDPALHRLEAVADVRERASDDDAHRVIEVRLAHLALEL